MTETTLSNLNYLKLSHYNQAQNNIFVQEECKIQALAQMEHELGAELLRSGRPIVKIYSKILLIANFK